MLYDVVVGGTKDKAAGIVDTVRAATKAAFPHDYCEFSVPDLGIFPIGAGSERQQSFTIESFDQKYILVCARESTDVVREVGLCKKLLENLTQHQEFSSLDRVWLNMNGQRLMVAPETPDNQLAQIYLRLVYDGRLGMLYPHHPATSLDEYVFTAAAVRNLTGEPVAFVCQGERRELKLGDNPREAVGRILYQTGA